MQISRIRLSDKTSRLHPRHVVPARGQSGAGGSVSNPSAGMKTLITGQIDTFPADI
jgi:hypothetical protein